MDLRVVARRALDRIRDRLAAESTERDPIDDPDIRRMDLKQLADLPFEPYLRAGAASGKLLSRAIERVRARPAAPPCGRARAALARKASSLKAICWACAPDQTARGSMRLPSIGPLNSSSSTVQSAAEIGSMSTMRWTDGSSKITLRSKADVPLRSREHPVFISVRVPPRGRKGGLVRRTCRAVLLLGRQPRRFSGT